MMKAFVYIVLATVCLTQSFGFLSHSANRVAINARNVQMKDSETTSFNGLKEYIDYLSQNAQLPLGFKVGAARFNFQPAEVAGKTLPMNVTIIALDEPTPVFAAMFTSNKFPGGPILVGKERMKSSKFLQAVVINNKISNVAPSGVTDRGAGDSERVCGVVAKCLGISSKDLVFPSSTGIIGWRLPVDAIEANLPLASSKLQSQSILPAALGITTTDRYPKLRRYTSKDGRWSVVGIAKGAGMIEPNMATMLSYIVTDLDMSKEYLDMCLKDSVQHSFNTISIDGDQSTSDTVLAISSQKVSSASANDLSEFQTGLKQVCNQLAEDIVRNGEGTQHVIKVSVTGAPDAIFARDLGRFVTNSNLVKCAIAGCDPNVGRIVGAIGSFLSKHVPNSPTTLAAAELQTDYTKDLVVTMGGIIIFENGAFQLDPKKEKLLSDYMYDCQLYPSESKEESRTYPTHNKCVDITIEMNYSGGRGAMANAVVIGSDLTKEYVEVNADYRS